MSLTRSVLIGFALAVATFGAGCSSSPISRIDANRALYESWPLDTQQAVLEGRVIKGMTKDQVEMSVGKPSEKTAQQAPKGLEEVWTYKPRGGGGLGGTSVSLGGMIGGVGVGGTPVSGGGGNTEEPNEVVFIDGVVVRSTFPQ